MPNIYLKVAIEKKWHTQNFDFLSLKSSSPGQSSGSPNSSRCHGVVGQGFGSKTVCGFSIILIFKGIWCFKVKESMLFVEPKYKI